MNTVTSLCWMRGLLLSPAKSTSNAQVMAFIKKFAPAKWIKDDSKFKLDKGARIETKTVDVDGEMVTAGLLSLN